MSRKQKNITGLTGSFKDSVANQGISFIVWIILARLFPPKEFGLIGMLTIFISISQGFINSGFQQALIWKKNWTEADYSTVFYFNIACGASFSVLDLLKAINEVLGKNITPIFAPVRKGDVKHSLADISLTNKLLDYEANIYFIEGIKRTVKWYLNL